MSVTLARPYAKALFALANSDALKAKWSAFLQVQHALLAEASVEVLLKDPRISATEKGNMVAELAAAVSGEAINELQKSFLQLMAQENRLTELAGVATVFESLLREQAGQARALVTSAMTLSAKQQQALQQALSGYFDAKVEMDFDIDASLVGGATIKVGDWVMDDSVKNKLARLRKQLQ